MSKAAPSSVSKTTTIRFKDGELELVKETARLHGLTVSSFLRACVITSLGVASREDASRLRFDEHLNQMRGLGTNLNQLAKMAHLGQIQWDESDKELIAGLLVSVRALGAVFQAYLKEARGRNICDPDTFEASFSEMLDLFISLESESSEVDREA